MLRKALGDEGPNTGTSRQYRGRATGCWRCSRGCGIRTCNRARRSRGAGFHPRVAYTGGSACRRFHPRVAGGDSSHRKKIPPSMDCLILVVSLGALVASVPALMSLRKTITPRHRLEVSQCCPFAAVTSIREELFTRRNGGCHITRLAASGHLVVRPTTAILEYANSPADPITIGRAQKVDTILFGTIEASSERMRVNVQLIRTVDRSLVWAGNFDGLASQIFDLEKEVEDKVAEAVSIQLPSRESSPGMTTRDPEANRLYLEGVISGTSEPRLVFGEASSPFNERLWPIPDMRLHIPVWLIPMLCWHRMGWSRFSRHIRAQRPPPSKPFSWTPGSLKPIPRWA